MPLIPDLDTLYVYDSNGAFPEMKVKGMKTFPYKKNSITHNSGMATMYRYVKDVVVSDMKRTLLMITYDEDVKAVEEFIDRSAEQIEGEKDLETIFSRAHTVPERLPITYK